MSQRNMVLVTKYSFGLYDLGAAAEYLGVSYSTLTAFVKNGYLPEKYSNKVLDMGDLVMLPIDQPPPKEAIGVHAQSAIMALIRGDFRQAISDASYGLQTLPMDWETASPVKPSELQRMYCELAHGLAWAKNPHASELTVGLPALRKLHQKVRRYMTEHGIDQRHPDWSAWKYLSAMTLGAAICYFVMLLGHGWFASEQQARRLQRDSSSSYRQRIAQRVLRNAELLQEVRPLFGQHRHVTVRVAWNVLQLSALAKSEAVFLDALSVLYGKLYQTFPAVLAALESDADTADMLILPSVRKFLQDKSEPSAA